MITQAQLKELLHYDPETGVFTWNVDRPHTKAGSEAGYVRPDGYRRLSIFNRHVRAHRLAFFYMTGKWPEHEVDHIDGNPQNNRWCNLRVVNRQTNLQNQRKPRVDNGSGFLGVSLHTQKSGSTRWRATIFRDGRRDT